MLKKHAYYILLVVFLFSYVLKAQVFPVNVTPQIIPPYSLKLSEYNTASSDKLILNLLLTDITESNRQVRLKFFVENNAGLSIQSNDVVIGANPIFLDGGVPLRLTNIDLQPYFALQNLRGINPQQYSVPLPEGLYRFCFEVYDAQSGQQISRKSCATVYLVLNDPPFLNIPNRGEQVLMREPQNIIFQWTPRHLNATNVEYEFTLAEIWDNQMDPQAAFLASRPLYQTNTFATTLLYGPAETSLLPDKTYGWRVRAMVSDGISETSVFKNDGYSEIYYFTYTGKCVEPEYILAEAKNTTSEKIFWQGVDHLRYNVQYRKKDAENSIWFEGGTLNEYTTIYNLEPGTTYEFRVGGQCLEKGPYTYSQIYEFTTILANDKESTYNCGITPEIIITNQDPLERLVTNEVFTAGDFPVTVKEVKGTNGSFSGWGYIVVPYLQDTKLKVSFDNISINTDYQLLEGIVVTDYDENWGDVDSVNDVIEVFEGDNDLESVQLDYDITINDIRVNDDGTITVTDPVTGAISKYPGGDDLVIVDSNGDVYHVDEDGNIRQGEPLAEGGGVDSENTPGVDENGNVSQLSAEGIKVEFITDNTYNYGFDAIPDGQEKQLESYYKQIKDTKGKTYTIVNKAVGNGATDKIKAKVTITDSNVSINDLVIKTANGENVKYEVSGSNEITLKLNGYYSFEHENIYATIQPKDNSKKQTIAGVFSLWHLSKKEVNVTIIPVDGVSLPSASELTSKINAIYGKASVNIKLTIVNDFKVDKSLYGGDTVQMGDSGFFTNYTEDQSSIINAYKSKETTSITSYYLFVFGNTIQPSRSDVAGFMPIKRQFGFIFNSNLSKEEEGKDNLAGTVAHELGHGVFGLEHPFTQLKTSKGATNWLMDYGNGVKLSHLDWAQIHNPDFKLYPFQDDEEGEYTNTEFGEKIFQIIRCAHINTTDPNGVISFDTSVFGKTGIFSSKWKGSDIKIKIDKGSFEGKAVYEPVEIGKDPESRKKNGPWRYSLLYKNVEIYILRTSTGADSRELDRLREYLFPKDKSQIRNETNEIVKEILQNNKLTKEHFEQLKSIANCGIQYFSAETRYRIISKIVSTLEANEDWLTEYYEDLILDLLETPPSTDKRSFNNEILQFLLDDYVLLEKLFKQTQDVNAAWLWAGNENNFSRLLNVLYKLWNNSKYEDESAYTYIDYVADYSTPRTSHLIHYDGKSWFPNVTYDSAVFNKEHLIIPADMGSRKGALKYKYYQPVMVIFENGDNSKVTKKIPAIIFAGNVKRDNLRKNLEKAELVMDVALTASGIGNLAKIKHLKNVGKISSFFEGLKGLDVLVSTANLLVKYSKPCDSPKQPQTKKEKTYCDMLGIFGDVLGLGIGYGDLVKRSAELKKAAGKVHKEIKDNPDLIPDGSDREKILKGLRKIAKEIGGDVSLEQLWKIYEDRNLFATILNSFENVKLGLSTVETLLKYSKTCKTDETCKAVQFYLGIIQKGIKIKELGDKLTKAQETEIKNESKVLLNKIKDDPKFLKDKPEKRKRLIEGLEVTEGIRIPTLKTVLSDLPENKHQNIKRLYDNASPDKKANLEKSWEILEPFRNTRFANDGKNLEILAKIHSRFVYNKKESFEGLKALMVEGSTANKQKLIDGLEEADKIFDSKLKLPIKFSGIKKGEVKVVDNENTEIARIDIEGNLIKKKFLDEADGAEVAGKYKEHVILRKGKEIGFKKIDNAKYDRSTINSINGFSDNVASIVSKHGISVENFKKIYQKMKYHQLKEDDKAIISAIRNSIPIPDGNTILQKVISKSDIEKYLDGTYNTVGGFITAAKDAKHLKTYEDIFYGMRLDYDGSDFKLSDGSCGIIRYKVENPNLTIPQGAGISYPYTGNGFTSGNNGRLGVPELESPRYTPQHGDSMFRLMSDGSEKLIAKFDKDKNKFVPAE
ncbi:hypothetical protein [Aquimarina atlantica]|nr:hypothetical protein [Aquimarina atlantica]